VAVFRQNSRGNTRLFAHILTEFILIYKRESSRRKWKSCSRMRRATAYFETTGDTNGYWLAFCLAWIFWTTEAAH
jgi:hypothetical protein